MRLPLVIALLASAPLAAQPPPAAAAPDTSAAGLRVERARLALARADLDAASGWRRLRPSADVFVSVSTRGLAFPSISARGYDPAFAAIARWPGDTWGVTVSWSLDQLLDRRPLERARAAVAIALARVDLVHARRARLAADERERDLARRQREADRRAREAASARQSALDRRQLDIEATFLDRRLDAQRELTRLAEMKYAQGETDYEALARQRLALLAAEHAVAAHAARRLATEPEGRTAPAERPALPAPSPD